MLPPGHKRRVFDKAKKQYGGSFDSDVVDSVKSVLAVIPVFITVIMYWAIYAQVSIAFFCSQLARCLTPSNTNLPAVHLWVGIGRRRELVDVRVVGDAGEVERYGFRCVINLLINGLIGSRSD